MSLNFPKCHIVEITCRGSVDHCYLGSDHCYVIYGLMGSPIISSFSSVATSL